MMKTSKIKIFDSHQNSKNFETLNCLLCHEKVFSELGKACKLCGMHLEDESREFCSRICRQKYGKINKSTKLNLEREINKNEI